MSLLRYFDRVFVINRADRQDRWRTTLDELTAHGFSLYDFERFDATINDDGHTGCTVSHRRLLRLVADGPWHRVLVLEDDIAVLGWSDLLGAGFNSTQSVWKTHASILGGYGTLCERFAVLEPFIPANWDVLYLGAGYGEPPISRVNDHVIRCGRMLTTSSYGVAKSFAKIFTDTLDGLYGDNHAGPIDNAFGSFAKDHTFYCLQPRLIFQRASRSDITGETNSYLFSQTDPVHEGLV